jgi:hypothetical protein
MLVVSSAAVIVSGDSGNSNAEKVIVAGVSKKYVMLDTKANPQAKTKITAKVKRSADAGTSRGNEYFSLVDYDHEQEQQEQEEEEDQEEEEKSSQRRVKSAPESDFVPSDITTMPVSIDNKRDQRTKNNTDTNNENSNTNSSINNPPLHSTAATACSGSSDSSKLCGNDVRIKKNIQFFCCRFQS